MLNDCSIDAIIAIDVQHTIIAWNATAEIVYGMRKAAVLGKPLQKVLPSLLEDPETRQAIARAYEGTKSFVPASKTYSHRVQVENHFIPLEHERGIIGVMNIVHDVAHRIKAEEQLQALNNRLEKQYRQLQQTSSELASFTFISSSNIKQPIRQIYTAVENLIRAEAGRLTDAGKAAFRRIQSSLSKMDLLLDDMLRLARISTLEKPETPVDLDMVLAEVTASLHKKTEEKGVNIVAESLCIIPGHKEQLYLLFQHLLGAALRFSENKAPAVRVGCEKVWASEFPEVALSEKEYCRITVQYKGSNAGLEEEQVTPSSSEGGQSGKYKNTGIEIAIARKIMNAHEGFIRVEHSPEGFTHVHCFFQATGQ
ncbi:MAG: PAS domain S-box protein [Williamsia sp.]|nr:PAS domain S-box protein [Williamsia sp.]